MSASAFWICTFTQSGESGLILIQRLDLELIALRTFISLGESGMGERKVGLEIERELQEDDPHFEAAFAGERIADAVEDLGQALCRRDHEKRRGFARLDLGEQRVGQGVARGLGDMGLERLAGELAVVGVQRVTRIGIGDPAGSRGSS